MRMLSRSQRDKSLLCHNSRLSNVLIGRANLSNSIWRGKRGISTCRSRWGGLRLQATQRLLQRNLLLVLLSPVQCLTMGRSGSQWEQVSLPTPLYQQQMLALELVCLLRPHNLKHQAAKLPWPLVCPSNRGPLEMQIRKRAKK